MKTPTNKEKTNKIRKLFGKRLNLLLVLGLGVFSIILFVAIGIYLGSFHQQYISRTDNAVKALATDKANMVQNWKHDRYKDAYLLRQNSRLSELALKLAEESYNDQIKEDLDREIKAFRTFHPYDVFIVNPRGQVLYSFPANAFPFEKEVYIHYLYPEGLKINWVDFYKTEHTSLFYLGLVVPLLSQQGQNALSFILRVNPAYDLFTAFIPQTRKNADVQSYFIFPWKDKLISINAEGENDPKPRYREISQKEKDSLMSSLMQQGAEAVRTEGMDGAQVLAAIGKVDETSWMTAVHLTDKEILETVQNRMWTIVLLGIAFILSIGALMIVLTRQQKIRLLKISRDNETMLDDLINNQPSGIYRVILDPEKSRPGKDKTNPEERILPIRYVFLSKQHEVITGIPEKELLENPAKIAAAVHPEDRGEFFRANYQAIDSVSSFHWEGRIINRGEVRWVRFDSVPRLNPPSQIIYTGVAMDITVQKKLESEMKTREAFERLLTRLSSSFVNITVQNCDQIIDHSIEAIGAFCNTDRSYVFLWDEKQNIVRNTHEWTSEGIVPQKENLQKLPCDEIPQWMSHLKNFSPIIIADICKMEESWSVEKSILELQGVKSLVVVPIISDEKLFGFVGFDSVMEYREWKEFELQLLKVFADLVYNALERSRTEVNLTESRKMLRTVLDTIQVRVFWKDKNLRYQGCNQAFANDAGFDTPEDIIGLDDSRVWKDMAGVFNVADVQVLKTGKSLLNFEASQMLPDGTARWLNTSKIPLLDNQGQIIGVLGTYQDVTEQKLAEKALKKSEKRYRTLTENAFDGIYLLRRNQFEYVNQRFCEMTGYSYEELTHADFNNLTLFTPESHQLAIDRKKARRNGEELPSTYEMQIVTTRGEIRDIEISTNKLNSSGEENLILGIVRDITERKNNEKLRNEVAVANQSATFKQNFLANMSHEIRTPLTGVLGMIEILSQTRLDEKQFDYVSTLKLSTENLREIINQILDYSKIEAGQVKLKTNRFETAVVFEHVRKLFQATCKKEVLLLINVYDDVPPFIEADEQRLTQIINNLLSNAIKFTRKGKIYISAQVMQWINEYDFILRVSVEDTGIGITKAALSRLFKPFEQVDHEDKRNFDGTGLGLSISKELVRLMGGEIFANSEPGKGSTFWFTVKAKKAPVEPVEDDANHEVGQGTPVGLTILFAEDKTINQKVVKLMLNAMGHKVYLASNGEEALKIYQPGLFDLILMDIQMPVMDGITAVKMLRESFTKLPPIVGLSANAFEGDREKYIQQGMDEYLTKPVKSNDLKHIIERLQLLKNKPS